MTKQLALVALLAASAVSAETLQGQITDPALRRKTQLVYVESAPGKFPPPPGLKKAMAEAGDEAGQAPKAKANKSKSKRKLVFLLAGGVVLLAILGGGFVAYQKLTAPPPEPPRKPRPVAKPAEPKPVPVDTAAVPETKPVPTEAAKSAEAKPAETAAAVPPEVKPAEEVKPVVPPPPPPPSVPFRSWVENLQIRGMRGGANPRVFIGNSSYGRGDLVNPNLGIVFEGVDEATHQLIFKDKTGAQIQRRQ